MSDVRGKGVVHKEACEEMDVSGRVRKGKGTDGGGCTEARTVQEKASKTDTWESHSGTLHA